MAADWGNVSKIARAYMWSFLIWGVYGPIMAAQNVVLYHANFWKLLLVALAWCITSATLTPPMFYIIRRYPISRQMGVRPILGYVLGAPVYVLLSASLRTLLLPPFDSVTQEFAHRTYQSLLDNLDLFAMQTWDYLVILVAAHAYAYFTRARNQEIEGARLQQALAESELQVLKSQLQPHFLFNTLHGISTLIDVDKSRAKLMVLKLSSLLRAVLEDGTADLISLRDELKFAEAYLDVEKMRLGDRLDIRWNVQAGNGQLLVPPLILQPLVENAIAHGVACSREGGWLEIAVQRMNARLEIRVRNSVRGKGTPGSGLGLRNVRARLNHLYSEEARFSLEFTEDGVATAAVILPSLGTDGREFEEKAATPEAKSA